MDCSAVADSLTPDAHEVLRVLTHHQRKRQGRTLTQLAGSTGRAVQSVALILDDLSDLDAVERRPAAPETQYFALVPCVCPLVTDTPPLRGGERSDAHGAPPESSHMAMSHATSTDSYQGCNPNGVIFRHNAYTLSNYFGTRLIQEGSWSYAGGVNKDALRKSLARWHREGLDYRTAKAMIDLFCKDPARWCRNGTPAWRAFIYNCTRLQHEVEKFLNNEERKANAENPEFWSGGAKIIRSSRRR